MGINRCFVYFDEFLKKRAEKRNHFLLCILGVFYKCHFHMGINGCFEKRAKKGVSKSVQKVLKVADLCHFMTPFWSRILGYFRNGIFIWG
jgi:hypothetical protein